VTSGKALAFSRPWIEAGCLLVLALLTTVVGFVSLGYGLWREGLPDAGLYPAAAAFICSLLSIVEAIRTFLGSDVAPPPSEEVEGDVPDWSIEGIAWKKLGIYAASFVLLVFTFDFLGFFAASGLVTVLILLFAERTGLLKSLTVGAGLVLASYVIFQVLLGVHFPSAGITQFWSQ
jgi:hypothetical protein